MPAPFVKKILSGIGLYLFSLSTVFALLDRAPATRYTSRSWHREDGLPDDRVSAVVQTADGFIWVATSKGLARFDGTYFWPMTLPDALPEDVPRDLCVAQGGGLWIGTAQGDIFSWRRNVFRKEASLPSDQKNSVITLRQSRDGTLWIGSRIGLHYYDGKTVTRVDQIGLRRDTIRALAEGSDGTLWVGGSYGVFGRKQGQQGPFTALEMESRLRNGVKAVFPDRQGTLWVGTVSQLLAYQDGQPKSFFRTGGLVDPTVTAIHQDRHNHLWVGTMAGLQRLENGKFITELTEQGDFYDGVSGIMEDREQNLWIGTQGGLYQLSPKLFSTFTAADGLAHNRIMSVMEDTGGALWLGTWGGGVQRFKDGGSINYTTALTSSGLLSDLVLALCETRDKSLWMGLDFSSGLCRWKDEKLQAITKTTGLHPTAVRVIYEDRSGQLWAGTSGALNLFKNGKFIQFTSTNGLVGNQVADLQEDAQGNLWIGTEQGLTLWKNEKFASVNVTAQGTPLNVAGLYLDRAGTMWIASLGSGLWRADAPTDPQATAIRFKNYTRQHGLLTDSLFEILEDDLGDLWMTSDTGIFRARKADFDRLDKREIHTVRCVGYDRSDGLNSTVCTRVAKPAAWKSRDGRLWFATAKGLSMVRADQPMIQDETPPPIIISHLLANGRRYLVTNGTPAWAMPPGAAEMEFHYASLSFAAPGKNRFKYKLEGFDQNWVEGGSQRFARYHKVPPGNYVFHVTGCNPAGVWNETGASLPISLPPFWWQTWWFRTGTGASLFLAGLAAYRSRIARIRAVESLRVKIAADLHDDVGASLTKVSVLMARLDKNLHETEKARPLVQKVATTTREIIRAMDEIVWTINPRNDTAEDFASYICHYAHEFFQGTDIRCRFDVPPDLPRFAMSAEVRHNLFLAFKEVLNNTVKHSGANEVSIQLLAQNKKLSLEISDNGRGFDPADHSGNGLSNLRQRLQKMGGDCVFATQPGNGSKINMEIFIR